MLKRKEDASKAQLQTPGITAAKRPKLMDLTQDGQIDIKRFLPQGSAKRPDRPRNNRERKAASMPTLQTVQFEVNQVLEGLRKYVGQHVEVRMPRDQLSVAAKDMKKRQIWGERIYTADTDLFHALVHQGFLPFRCSEPSFQWPDALREIRVLLKVHPSMQFYPGTLRNGLRSRAWASACFNCAYSIDRAWIIATNEVEVELDAVPAGTTVGMAQPYFLLSQWDQRMNTRQITHASDRRKRNQADVASIIYNLVNEPWLKYTSTCMADRGFTPELWTCTRFLSEVVYLETASERFELQLVRAPNGAAAAQRPTYSFRKCKEILPQDVMLMEGTPLPAHIVSVVHDKLLWEHLLWGSSGVEIHHAPNSKGQTSTTYELQRIHWMPISKPREASL